MCIAGAGALFYYGIYGYSDMDSGFLLLCTILHYPANSKIESPRDVDDFARAEQAPQAVFFICFFLLFLSIFLFFFFFLGSVVLGSVVATGGGGGGGAGGGAGSGSAGRGRG